MWPLPVIALTLRLPAYNMWATFVIYHLLCLGIARKNLRRAGLVSGSWQNWIPVSLFVSIPLILAMYGGILLTYRLGIVTGASLNALSYTSPWFGFVLYILCFNPLIEEYYWRGFLLERAGRLPTAGFFALMHYPLYSYLFGALTGFLACLSPFLLGLLWGWLLKKYASLWPAVITHLAVNAGMMLAATRILARYPSAR